jgi:hypothetical protein
MRTTEQVRNKRRGVRNVTLDFDALDPTIVEAIERQLEEHRRNRQARSKSLRRAVREDGFRDGNYYQPTEFVIPASMSSSGRQQTISTEKALPKRPESDESDKPLIIWDPIHRTLRKPGEREVAVQ